jgi:adenosylcobinamide-GDP ribazoletransferase
VSGLLGALAFLTRLPVPGADVRLEYAVVWLPVVGVILGAILAAADIALHALPLSSLVISVGLVVLLLGLTGALHADGLMDTCDAVFGHATPERRLEIMRDPRAGAFGVVGLLCVVLLKVASIDALPLAARAGSLILAPTLGRWAIVLLAGVFPYGRPSGLGAPLKAGATPRRLAVASLVATAACLVLWPVGLVLGVLAAVTALLMGRWLVSLLPGLTGDCYGATCEVVETVVWLAAAPLVRLLG